ncbi:hypothetical protein V6N12_008222 [Hibiscus sabdariffa]|uniref:Uncharacterized protein n=1 Tax=Hibiscus sabdariffa TaxID=183260 RepID=A0ABR1Z6W9_9ROSI
MNPETVLAPFVPESRTDPRVSTLEIMEPGGTPFEKSFIQPSMDRFVEDIKQDHEKEEIESSTTLVSNGCVDIRGKIADKQTTGGWKASPFIIGIY